MIYPEGIPPCLIDWLDTDTHKHEVGVNRNFSMLVVIGSDGHPRLTLRFTGVGADGLRHTTFFVPTFENEIQDGLLEWFNAADLPIPRWLELNQ